MTPKLKDRVRQLYRFLKEANQLRFPPVRRLKDQPRVIRLADMPAHPDMQFYRPVAGAENQEIPDLIMSIKRPPTTRCPTPPDNIATWLLSGWDDPTKTAAYAESRNQLSAEGETTTVRFDGDLERVQAFAAWCTKRDQWVPPECASRTALQFFELFYDLYSAIEKDEELLELMAADGHLSWRTESSNEGQVSIEHPILFKRVELRFDPKIPQFTVHETDRTAELYSGLFVDLKAIAPLAIKNRQRELESAGYHPLGWEDTAAFLKAFAQTISPLDGVYLDAPPTGVPPNAPVIWRDPVLFVRERVAGIANAVDAIIDDIEARETFPSALAQITGSTDQELNGGLAAQPFAHVSNTGGTTAHIALSDDDILLAKQSNAEQIQIIHRLHSSGSVIVQGPPGTGKTHTIGNIVGHLLAHGKSILVTAQTAKALRVVREQVPEVLRPLCVAVLGGDQNTRRQLESSIGTITERLTSESATSLLTRAEVLEAQRRDLVTQCRILTHKLRQALENEYREIPVEERRYSPSQAAKLVAQHRDKHAWIPGNVKPGVGIGLTVDQLSRLYVLGTAFTAAEEKDARAPVPDLAKLPPEAEFKIMVAEYQDLTASDLSFGLDRWRSANEAPSSAIAKLAEVLAAEFSDDLRRQVWRPYAIVAGIHGGQERTVWERLIEATEKAVDASTRHALVLHHRPQLSTELPVLRQWEVALEIKEHLSSGGKLGMLQLATRSEWRALIKTATVAAGRPNHPDHFAALECRAELEDARVQLEALWDSLVGQYLDRPFRSLGATPEMACRPLIHEIRRCLDWKPGVWAPIQEQLLREGLDFERVLASVPNEPSQISEYLVTERIAVELLPRLLEGEIRRRRLKECERAFAHSEHLAAEVDPTAPDRGCIGRIVAAVRKRDADAYRNAQVYARRLIAIRPLVAERDALTRTLRTVAPEWAAMVYHRAAPHGTGQIPGDVESAWTWRQLYNELRERDKLEASAVQAEIEAKRDRLRQITEWLIDAKAWGKQLERLQGNHAIRQALVGWLDTVRRLASTRQVDRRNALLSESRKLMTQCIGSVPVWVMPISGVSEYFDPRTTRFDVVIVDEASQADLNALIPLYMGSQIVVVGDHEQVTPLGVGRDQTTLANLRNAMLEDIPNAHLFDNQASIYDIGRQSFGDAIRLVEHFRCVPEIIAFSNQLSYEGKIRPLRESNSTDLKPACVPYRVDGIREGDVNKKEADTIVDMIKAMTRHKAYAGKTIGVISMLKDSQALLIQSLLHKSIDSEEIQKRRIQVGSSAEFQGDERDIMFLSMVDSQAEEGTLRTTGDGAFEQTKKRYNVAASRARDQLWVVHSFDPNLHLKAADLRHKLLQHVRDPWAAIRAFDKEVQRTESPFEREVLKRLTSAGYGVKTQWQVGFFRIDLVVEGAGRRLAVECDGDRFHPMEKLAEDMERQAILERLGWQFVRIRGSAYYRDSEQALRPLFARLDELGIPPEQHSEPTQVPKGTLIEELEALVVSLSTDANLFGPTGTTTPLPDEESEDEELLTDLVRGGNGADRVGRQEGDVERLLRTTGGVALVDDLLRRMSQMRGYKRLGRAVRKSLVYELTALKRRGTISVENGMVRLSS